MLSSDLLISLKGRIPFRIVSVSGSYFIKHLTLQV